MRHSAHSLGGAERVTLPKCCSCLRSADFYRGRKINLRGVLQNKERPPVLACTAFVSAPIARKPLYMSGFVQECTKGFVACTKVEVGICGAIFMTENYFVQGCRSLLVTATVGHPNGIYLPDSWTLVFVCCSASATTLSMPQLANRCTRSAVSDFSSCAPVCAMRVSPVA